MPVCRDVDPRDALGAERRCRRDGEDPGRTGTLVGPATLRERSAGGAEGGGRDGLPSRRAGPQLLRTRRGDLAQLLDENGLKSCGMHLGLGALQGEAFDKTVEIHQVIGMPYLIVASLPHQSLASLPAIAETGKLFNELAERLTAHGTQIGYHCHGGDFAKMEAGPHGNCLAKTPQATSCCNSISAIAWAAAATPSPC